MFGKCRPVSSTGANPLLASIASSLARKMEDSLCQNATLIYYGGAILPVARVADSEGKAIFPFIGRRQ